MSASQKCPSTEKCEPSVLRHRGASTITNEEGTCGQQLELLNTTVAD